ncbi:hypothetical protein [Rhodococcoides fascians]|uniref:hypothetical protein n=1 Tax=Rhodococcoides fascians TaxID=1828 RepID=UPI00056A493B|nr:hypothetical protein [Rhodococcus fascians]
MTDEHATDTDDSLPARVRDTITVVHDAAGDLEPADTGPDALTVQVCSASELAYDPATWTTVGTYLAADAALLADRLVDALGDSANLHTDTGVLVITHTYTDIDIETAEVTAMNTHDITVEPPLLTLHADRVQDLEDNMKDPAGNDSLLLLQQHWLLQAALDSAVITYDRHKWGDLTLSATFDEPNQHEIVYQITYDIAGAPNVVDGAATDYPADFNELDDDAQNQVPSTLVPNPPTAAGWLSLIVDGLNDLHRGTTMLVRGWPQ